MKKALAAFLALFFVSALAAFPQGSFLKKGQTGFGLTGAYATNSSTNGFTGVAGLSLGGIFDFSLGAGRAAAAADASELADLEITTFAPQLTVHILKQNSSNAALSLALSIGYAHDKYSSPDLDAVGFTMWAESFMLGATVYRDVPLGPKLTLQPFARGGYTNTSFKVRNAAGQTGSAEDDIWSLGIGLPLVYGLSGRALLVFEPGLTTDKNATTFSVALGLVYILKTGK